MYRLTHIAAHLPNTLSKVLVACFLVFGAQNTSATTDNSSASGIRPYGENAGIVPTTSHWTLYLDAGGNWFDADYPTEAVNALFAPTVGLGFTYNFNPTWGLGVEGLYSTLRITDKGNSDNELLKANMYRIQALSSFDIVNAWRPNNQNKIFALNILAGGGAGIYKRSNYTSYKSTNEPQGSGLSDNSYNMCPMLVAGADFQFNVSRSISLGLKGTYSFFVKDDIDGRVKGTNNDGIVDLTLSLRYKIDAVKKSHVCNVADESRINPKTARQTGIGTTGQDGTGNAEVAPARVDTLVLVQRDTLVITNTAAPVRETTTSEDNYYYIYFATNQSALKSQDLMVIQQVASRLQRDNNLYVEIVGFCDNTGSEKYNLHLGEIRANNVVNEFVEEYEIPYDHILSYSGGIIQGKRSKAAYGPNRRVEIRLITEEQFQKAKQEQRQQQNEVVTPDQAASQTAQQERTVVLEKGMTLGHLAQREYGNANCWVYIYQANKADIADPDHVQYGQKLILPALTEEQRAITSAQAAEQSNEVRGNQPIPSELEELSGNMIAKEETRADWTLGKMARKHYGNAYCWVYIYKANKANIADPDKIYEGMEIDIPELTEAQQAITKQQANRLLENLK